MSALPVTFATEAESAVEFDRIAQASNLFTIYQEVPGTLIQPRPAQRERTVRIDRILVPNTNLLAAGWTRGIIGVEIKRNSEQIGPYIAQAMDYSRSVWTLPTSHFQVMLDWVFVWPIPKQMGPMASLMAQNRVGTATSDNWTPLQFKAGENNVLRVNNDGTVRIGAQGIGRKVGSR